MPGGLGVHAEVPGALTVQAMFRALEEDRPGSSSTLQVGEMIHAASDKPASKEKLLQAQVTGVEAPEAPASRRELRAMGFAIDTYDHETVFGDVHVFEDATGPSDMFMTRESLGPLTSTLASEKAGLNISADPLVMFGVEVIFLGNNTLLGELTDSDILSQSIAEATQGAFYKLRKEFWQLMEKVTGDTPVVGLTAKVDELTDNFRVALHASVL